MIDGHIDAAMSNETWELFELITSAYYGKMYYFRNEDGTVYSRASHENMSEDAAVREFLDHIWEG